jgi:membrane protease subunit HflC
MSGLTRAAAIFLILWAGVLLGYGSCCYTVDQRDAAIVSLFGDIREVVTEPGLHFKNPLAAVNTLRTYLEEYNTEPSNTVTRDKKNILISFYVKYRIVDALKYAQTVGVKPEAEKRIDDVVYSALKTNVSLADFDEVVTSRTEIEKRTLEMSRERIRQFGLDLVDFQIKRSDMPPQILDSVYKRMTEERRQKAQTDRSEGDKLKQIATAMADKREMEIRSEAYAKKQELMGEGDRESLRLLSEAYAQDVEFALFVRTLDVYREALKSSETRLILSTKNELLRFLRDPAPDRK